MRGIKNIFEKMNGKVFVAAFVALASILSLSSCHKHYTPEQQPSLQISVYIPQPLATKADVGDIKATEAEKIINELVVWLYRNTDAQTAPSFYCLHLKDTELAKYNLESGQEARFSVKLDTDELKQIASQKPNLDLYAIANPTSAGLALPSNEDALKAMTREQLLELSMTGDTFGATSSGCPKTEVPAEGLPYSGVATNVRISGSFPVLVVSKVILNRCVSKFRLVVCRMEVEDSEFEITNVTINGNQFSVKEYVFNDSSKPYKIDADSGYETDPVTVASSVTASGIAINNTPGGLLFRSVNHESETADQYWSRLDVAKEAGILTDLKTFYVRETDKQLKGTISYKTSSTGPVKTKTFEMNAAGDFARNHVWVVYAYFVGGRLVLMPTVLPWTAGNDRYFFKTQGRTDIYVSSWLRYTLNGVDNNWTDTWIAVAYGFDEHTHKPLYSTQIDVDLVNQNQLRLQLDNDNFRFVIKDENHTTPIVWDHTVSGLASDIIYEMAPGAHNFTFWIIPKDDSPYSGEASMVGLKLIAVPTNATPYMIPISHNFPGNSAHSDIRFRCVSADAYSRNKDNVYTGDGVPGDEDTWYWIEPKS